MDPHNYLKTEKPTDWRTDWLTELLIITDNWFYFTIIWTILNHFQWYLMTQIRRSRKSRKSLYWKTSVGISTLVESGAYLAYLALFRPACTDQLWCHWRMSNMLINIMRCICMYKGKTKKFPQISNTILGTFLAISRPGTTFIQFVIKFCNIFRKFGQGFPSPHGVSKMFG